MANLEQPFIPVGVAIARTASGEPVYATEAQTRFYLSLWNRTGYAPGVSIDDLELLQALLSQGAGSATSAVASGVVGALLLQRGPEQTASSDLAGVALLQAIAALGLARAAYAKAAAGGGGNGTITAVTAGTGLTGGGASGNVTLNIGNTTVAAGNYTNPNITINAQGQIVAAGNGSIVSGATWLPLVNGAEPPAFITDGAGVLITVAYAP